MPIAIYELGGGGQKICTIVPSKEADVQTWEPNDSRRSALLLSAVSMMGYTFQEGTFDVA